MPQANEDRIYWIDTLSRIAQPVLHHLSNRNLKDSMPIEGKTDDRPLFTHLEALGRLLTGMAPWLETGSREGEEGRLREHYAEWARQSIDAGTDPSSPDFMNFSEGYQPIVDAAFLAHAILRAPQELWEKLDPRVQHNVVNALKATRTRKPGYNNWLLFSAMIEAALYRAGTDWDRMRVDYALRQHELWYKGDGIYGDGPDFHADYYNSFVIQPMLVDIINTLGHEDSFWAGMKENVTKRAQRYATQQERLISPEGTFPAVGRSLAYRFGAFQLLSQVALQHQLEASLEPAQVRCALTAVIRRMIEAPGTFDENGWLTIGFCGHQPEVGETYISTGSLYLCAAVFLPLGLPADDPFWQGEAAWTAQKAWSGQSFAIDKALY
ncbi:DUF2264 domain-containing protein [Paenibacillus radicis (ex Xue et al. 2023)]|uniref:DUF2264 domain-containing protein n=1 Tax=Paenibacillus radicis (ex Xue et al. 2023) TaxID=2972489 RepID=A0ABT1YE48_9BACL|nr:DUF2264 domain-containing protein [Paenibacillus radicis (ex Xue et al. 2023)]MCR8631465.1 DUF2264 domain-containing protein [Paenibacillus radicis (ex Xue et al. 2023)]